MVKIFLEAVGKYFLFLRMVFRKPEKWKIFWKQFVLEADKLILSSILIVGVISVFIGGVLVIQTASNMQNPMLDRMYVGYMVRESLVLEFCSTMVALMLAGKMGSNIASEIGSMRISEQIDAMDMMGVNSACYLVLPKVMSSVLLSPFLMLLSLAFGLLPACVWPHVRRFFRRHLVREVPVEVTVEVPVEIPVVVAESSHPANYRLKDGTVFYGEQSALVREGQRIRLTAQAATLLRALLERPGEEVSTAVLMDRLWPDGSGNETRLYKSVDRLNKVLKEISTCRVESHWGTYCLRQDDGKSDKV